jgi:hypothetical protein
MLSEVKSYPDHDGVLRRCVSAIAPDNDAWIRPRGLHVVVDMQSKLPTRQR